MHLRGLWKSSDEPIGALWTASGAAVLAEWSEKGAVLRKKPSKRIILGILDAHASESAKRSEAEARVWAEAHSTSVERMVAVEGLLEAVAARILPDTPESVVVAGFVGGVGLVGLLKDGSAKFSHLVRAEDPGAPAEVEKALRHVARMARLSSSTALLLGADPAQTEKIAATLRGLGGKIHPTPLAETDLAGCLAPLRETRAASRVSPWAVAAGIAVLLGAWGIDLGVKREVSRLETARVEAMSERDAIYRQAGLIENRIATAASVTSAADVTGPASSGAWIRLLVFLGRSIPPGISIDEIATTSAVSRPVAAPYGGLRRDPVAAPSSATPSAADYMVKGRGRSLEDVARLARIFEQHGWVVTRVTEAEWRGSAEDPGAAPTTGAVEPGYDFTIEVRMAMGGLS